MASEALIGGRDWRLKQPGMTIDAFRSQLLTDGVFAQSVLRARRDGETVGLVQLIGYRPHARDAWLTLMVKRRLWGDGWPLEGAMRFVSFAFEELPIDTLRCEVDPAVHRSVARVLNRLCTPLGMVGERPEAQVYEVDRETWVSSDLHRLAHAADMIPTTECECCYAEIVSTVSRCIGTDSVNNGLDELALLVAALAIETRFDLTLDEELLASLHVLGDLLGIASVVVSRERCPH